MTREEDLAAGFTAARPRLTAIAYAIVGSHADAEDIVSDTWLRMQATDSRAPVRDVDGWATVAVGRAALDHYRSARVRRERYVGPWLPEPRVASDATVDPADRVTLDDQVSFALLVVLESLTPAERTAWVLHDLFGLEFTEVADAVGRSPDAVRQLAARARRHLRGSAPRVDVDATEHARVVARFLAATGGGDIAALVAVLDPRRHADRRRRWTGHCGAPAGTRGRAGGPVPPRPRREEHRRADPRRRRQRPDRDRDVPRGRALRRDLTDRDPRTDSPDRLRARAGQAARVRTNGHTMSTGTTLAMHRTGTGTPLVLLHALGSSSHAWEPVLPYLVDGFEVLAVDLPGFGAIPRGPAGSEQATPAALAAAVDVALSEAGIHDPHVVGNSLGGWVALELSHRRPVASLTLLSPAGMWARDTPAYCRLSLRGTRWLTQHAQRLLDRLVEHRLGRILALGQTHGHPTRVSPDQARAAIHEMASCTGFDAALEATTHRHYRRPDDDRAQPPTTVAFGSRDRLLLLPRWRGTGELPGDAVVARLPGCGHIPMYDDPAAVAQLITGTVTRSTIPALSRAAGNHGADADPRDQTTAAG